MLTCPYTFHPLGGAVAVIIIWNLHGMSQQRLQPPIDALTTCVKELHGQPCLGKKFPTHIFHKSTNFVGLNNMNWKICHFLCLLFTRILFSSVFFNLALTGKQTLGVNPAPDCVPLLDTVAAIMSPTFFSYARKCI